MVAKKHRKAPQNKVNPLGKYAQPKAYGKSAVQVSMSNIHPGQHKVVY